MYGVSGQRLTSNTLEGESYGRKLLQADVPVTSARINGVIHGFMSIPMLHSPETLAVIDMTTNALRKVFYNWKSFFDVIIIKGLSIITVLAYREIVEWSCEASSMMHLNREKWVYP